MLAGCAEGVLVEREDKLEKERRAPLKAIHDLNPYQQCPKRRPRETSGDRITNAVGSHCRYRDETPRQEVTETPEDDHVCLACALGGQ